VMLRPGDPAPRLALAGAHAQLGHRDAALVELEAALARMDPSDALARADAHLDAARWFRSSLCDPAGVRDSADRGLAALAGRDDADDLRAELLLSRAWAEVTTSGADAADGTLRELEALRTEATDTPLRRQDVQTVRGFVALANGRLDEAEQLLVTAGRAGGLAARPDMAYGGWTNAACIAAAAGRFVRALEYVEQCEAIVAGLPVLEFQIADLHGYMLARLGRHDEVGAQIARMTEIAARLGSRELAAVADHDAGLFALLAEDYERAAELLGRALAADAPVQIAEARLRRAEALARLGRANEADAEIRAAALAPMRPSHRPAVLVARMAFAQGLSARARGDDALAERRLAESAAHWRRLAPDAATEFLASLVDLGRPPVTGIVDPVRELERVRQEIHAHVR
jgi:tetratricopeptide (TPR) repeat protein